MINNLIEIRQGDSFVITLHLIKQDKDLDLSGSTATLQVRTKDDTLVWSLEADTVEAASGRLVFCITPQLSNIDLGDYLCDIQLQTADGSINTIFPANVNQVGIFRITKQITKEDE